MDSIVLWTWTGRDSLALRGNCLYLDYLGKQTTIPISQIISFEIKDPKGKMRPGMITIRLGGASDTRIHLTSFFSVGGSNNIEFPHSYEYTQKAYEMQRAIASYSANHAPKSLDGADEIRKYKALLDDGIISQEESDAKKKQILGI